MINIIIRADASLSIGTGHIMRCLTLAHELHHNHHSKKVSITFICRKLPLFLKTKITPSPFKIIELKGNDGNTEWNQIRDAAQCIELLSELPKADLLIQDHYQLNMPWQELLQPYYHKLLVIDDLANRKHKANFLLDQTFDRHPQDYQPWLNKDCQLLAGKTFILLRKEFIELIATAKKQRKQTREIRNILLSLGGMDPDNISQVIVNAIIVLSTNSTSENHLSLDLVMSSSAPYLANIKQLIKPYGWINMHIDSNHMASLMLKANIAIGACGSSAWERCSLGLPTLSVQLAENQALVSKNLANHGAIIDLGLGSDVTTKKIINALKLLINDNDNYQLMVEKCFQCCDGKGAHRVSTEVIKPSDAEQVQLTLATLADCEAIFQWQSDKNLRKFFKQPETPTWQEHSKWFENNLSNSSSSLYVICSNDTAVGTLRLDQQVKNEYEVSILIKPTAQGKGLGLHALNQLPLLIKNGIFFADIHKDNISSHNIFLKAGFSPISPTRYALKIKEHNRVPIQYQESQNDNL